MTGLTVFLTGDRQVIFLLSSDIVPALSTSSADDIINGLQLLADSRRCGQNEILGEREDLLAISRCGDLSKSARAIFDRLSKTSSQTYTFRYKVPVYVLVTAERSVCRRESDGRQEKIVVSLDKLANKQRLTQTPTLLCENLDDCVFLNRIGSLYGAQNKLHERIEFTHYNGGGSTTAPNYRNIISKQEDLCLCIADSDKKFEGDNEKGTAQALREVETECGKTLTSLYILNCHEAENLIPASILSDVYNQDVQKADSVTNLEQLQTNRAHELWRYFDVKKGLKVFEMVNAPNAQYQNSWSRAFGLKIDIEQNYCGPCQKRGSCEKEEHCCVYLGKGFGTTVLSDTVDKFLDKKRPAEILRRLREPILSEWVSIGRTIWGWGFAGYRLPAC